MKIMIIKPKGKQKKIAHVKNLGIIKVKNIKAVMALFKINHRIVGVMYRKINVEKKMDKIGGIIVIKIPLVRY